MVKTPLYSRHLSAYAWAAQYCGNKAVIELGCGEGFGLSILSLFAETVTGIDISPKFLNRASKNKYYCPHNLILGDAHQANTEKLPAFSEPIIVAFEFLEHIEYPKLLLESIRGIPLIFSVPHDYPHPLHKTDFRSDDDVSKFIGRPYDPFYMDQEGFISREKPDNLYRYMGLAMA